MLQICLLPLVGGGVVCYTAVFSVVMQRSSPQTAAENQTTFLSLCICGLTNKPITYLEIDCDVSFCGSKRFRVRGYEHAFQQVMNGGTPKKIVDSDSKCFTCSSLSANAEKIYIFGKSSIDLQGIIKSSLNVDVSCFANSGKIFVCKSCYKRLTKFQRSSEKLNEIHQKIEEAFKKRDVPRTKRLQRASEDLHGNIPEGNHQDQVRDMSRTQESLGRQKVSKSLQFATGEATTCTSSANSSYQDFSSWKQPVPAYLPGFLSPIQSQPSLLLSAFPNQNMASP